MIGVSIHEFEGTIIQSSVIIQVCLHVPSNIPSLFLPTHEVIFNPGTPTNTTPSGANAIAETTPTDLLNCLSEATQIPKEFLKAAKYRIDRFDWIPIVEQIQPNPHKKRKGKATPPKPNVKNAPVNLKDNDIIGVKDTRHELPGDIDKWCFEWDQLGQKYLQGLQEEKKRKRKEKKDTTEGGVLGLSSSTRSNRKEKGGINISVPDYSEVDNDVTNTNEIPMEIDIAAQLQ